MGLGPSWPYRLTGCPPRLANGFFVVGTGAFWEFISIEDRVGIPGGCAMAERSQWISVASRRASVHPVAGRALLVMEENMGGQWRWCTKAICMIAVGAASTSVEAGERGRSGMPQRFPAEIILKPLPFSLGRSSFGEGKSMISPRLQCLSGKCGNSQCSTSPSRERAQDGRLIRRYSGLRCR